MAAIEYIRVPGIEDPLKLGDWVHSALRSAINFSSAETAGDDTIFNYTVGGTTPGGGAGASGKFETNMPDTGRLPQGMEALIYFMGVVFPPVTNTTGAQSTTAFTLADARDIEAKVTWELRINASKKIFDDGAASRFPSGGGISGFSALYGQASQTERTLVTNGFPGANAKQPYAIPHHLNPLEPFDCNVNVQSALSISGSSTVRVNLEGLIKRVVG